MIVKNLQVTLEFEAVVTHYRPPRPSPHSQDHDSPRFSDPGDDEECEYKLVAVIRHNGSIIRGEVEHLDTIIEMIDCMYRDTIDDVCDEMRQITGDLRKRNETDEIR